MAASRRQQLIEAILARLAIILPANGYATDAGLRVHYGRIDLTPDDTMPVILLRPGASSAQPRGNRVERLLPLTVQAIAQADVAQPLAPIEPLIDDVQRALLEPSTWLFDHGPDKWILELQYGDVTTVDREPGGAHVAAEIGLVIRFREQYGELP